MITAALCKLSTLPAELALAGLYEQPEAVLVQHSRGTCLALEDWLQASRARLDDLQFAYDQLLRYQTDKHEVWTTVLPDQCELRQEMCRAEAAIRLWLTAGTYLSLQGTANSGHSLLACPCSCVAHGRSGPMPPAAAIMS